MQKDNKVPLNEVGDVLDQIKEVEQAVKARALIKTLVSLKEFARDILTLKVKTSLLLEELGISESDSKRVVDFINNSTEVQLTEADKEKIREHAKTTIKEKKKSAQEELEKRFLDNITHVGGAVGNFVGYSQIGTNASNNASYLSTAAGTTAGSYMANSGLTLTSLSGEEMIISL